MLQDHLGSTTGTVNTGGTAASTISYFSFGALRFSTGTLPTDKKFTGQRLDNTGLYYYGARYYDPALGRFISPDTVVQNPSKPQTLNRYSYCLNNPLKFVDPSGHTVGFETTPAQPGQDPYMAAYSQLNSLHTAWNTLLAIANSLASYLEKSTVYTVISFKLGMNSTGDTPRECFYTQDSNGGWVTNFKYGGRIDINLNLMKDSVFLAATIGHESFHAAVALNALSPDSKYEEACAYSIFQTIYHQLGGKGVPYPEISSLSPVNTPDEIDINLNSNQWGKHGCGSLVPYPVEFQKYWIMVMYSLLYPG